MSYSTLSIDWEDFGQLLCMYHYDKVTEPVNAALHRNPLAWVVHRNPPRRRAIVKARGVTTPIHNETGFGQSRQPASRPNHPNGKIVIESLAIQLLDAKTGI